MIRRETTYIFTCDRCGKELSQDSPFDESGEITQMRVSGAGIYDADWTNYGKDLCIDCWQEFLEWWKNGQE